MEIPQGEDGVQFFLALMFFVWAISAILQASSINLWIGTIPVGHTPQRVEGVIPVIGLFATIYCSTRWKSDQT